MTEVEKLNEAYDYVKSQVSKCEFHEDMRLVKNYIIGDLCSHNSHIVLWENYKEDLRNKGMLLQKDKGQERLFVW